MSQMTDGQKRVDDIKGQEGGELPWEGEAPACWIDRRGPKGMHHMTPPHPHHTQHAPRLLSKQPTSPDSCRSTGSQHRR